MENCLITTLKESISDNSLPRIGQIHLHVKSASFTPTDTNTKIYLSVASGVVFKVECTNGNHIAKTYADLQNNATNELTYTGNNLYQTLFFENGDYDIFISKKYDQKGILGTNNPSMCIDLSEFAYAEKMTTIRYTQTPNITGDISALEKLTLLTEFSINSTLVTGDIKSFPSSINKIVCTRNSVGVGNSVEEFVASQISKGRSTCTEGNGVEYWDILENATFGGINQNLPWANRYVYWSSASKIWVIGGGYVVAKGATQAEIAAWEEQEYTVIHFDDVD